VIEGELVEFHDICTATFVFSMATAASLLADPDLTTMEAGLFIDILQDFLVTGQAQICLPGFVETVVTVVTLVFVFGVALDDLTRHHQGFKGGGA